jgi:hypothetical protein
LKLEAKNIKGGRWKIWRYPVKGHTYAMGVDTASGKAGANESVATIVDMNDGHQCAIMAGIIEPIIVKAEAEKMGYFYNEALIGVEKEYHGITVMNGLRDNKYPNLYFHATHQTTFGSGSTEYGWDALRYRQTAIDWLQEALGFTISTSIEERKRGIWVHDPGTVSQLGYFVRDKKTGKFQALAGRFDDRVSALYIANFLRHEKFGELFSPPPLPEKKLSWLDKVAALARRDEDDRELGDRDE